MSGAAGERQANQLLAAVPQEELARVEPLLTEVQFGLEQVVYDVDALIEHVYFP